MLFPVPSSWLPPSERLLEPAPSRDFFARLPLFLKLGLIQVFTHFIFSWSWGSLFPLFSIYYLHLHHERHLRYSHLGIIGCD
jgi:hypothetical protein